MRIANSNAPRLAVATAVMVGAIAMTMLFASRADAAADLALTKTDAPDPVVVGNNLTYTITASNVGDAPATNVVVTDQLPANVDFVSASSPDGTCDRSGNTVTCNLGTINNGGPAKTVTLIVQPKKQGTITNTASVTSTEDPTGASATATTTVQNKGQGGKKAQPSCATPTHTGTAGDDIITGTNRADVIVTLGGNDQVFALDGKDLVCTGAGFDLVKGGDKNDTIIGGSENDRLVGQAGGDLLKGKAGRDKLRGKSGNDTLNGGSGRDSCKGGAGADTLKRCP